MNSCVKFYRLCEATRKFKRDKRMTDEVFAGVRAIGMADGCVLCAGYPSDGCNVA